MEGPTFVRNRPYKIAILADFPWSFFELGATGRGGGQACTWLAQLAEELASHQEFEIHWVTLDRTRWRGPVERRTWRGQTFHRLAAGKLKIDLALGYLPSRIRLNECLRGLKPDLIHCWGTERAYPVACGALGVPSILSMQGILSNLQKADLLGDGWVWWLMASREPGFVRAATVVTCESRWAIDRIREVAPGVDARQVEYGVHSGFYDIPWNPDPARPCALYVGTISCGKGIDVLFDALEAIKDRKWTLKLAGDGPLRNELEARNVPGVEWLGTVAWDRLQRELAAASCLVHPTRADSSPNAVKEARVVGLPVITTIHGGQAGYIVNGENGLIVDPLEPEGLARALERVMSNPRLAQQMGATRHELDRAYFRPANTAKGFLELYAELLGA